MIKFSPFFTFIKENNISTYKLRHKYNVSNGLLYRMRHNEPISTESINNLCNILGCKVEDILIHEPDIDKNP